MRGEEFQETAFEIGQNAGLSVADENRCSLTLCIDDEHLFLAYAKGWWEMGVSERHPWLNAKHFKRTPRLHAWLNHSVDLNLPGLEKC